MTEQEKIDQQLQRQIDMQNGRIDALVVKVDALSDKIDAFVNESRAARERQDADIREMRQKQDAAQAKHDADMKEMNQRFYAKFDAMDTKIDNIGNNVRSLTITAMIGVGASVIAVVVLVGTTLFAVMSR